MNREELRKAVADAVVGFARSEAEAARPGGHPEAGGSADEEPHRPTGSGNPDYH